MNTVRIAFLGVALLSCPRAHADVALDEVRRIDLGGALTNESRTTTAISGSKARIENAQTIRSPFSSVPDEGTDTTVQIVRGDRGKVYTYVVGTSQYIEQDLRSKMRDGLDAGAERAPANCSSPKTTVSTHAAAAIAGFETNEVTVRVTQKCKDRESARACTAVLTAHRWMAADVPFAAETAALSKLAPEFGGLFLSPGAPDLLIEQARASFRTMLNVSLNAQLWHALESKTTKLPGVALKSTLELAAVPCYPLFADAPSHATAGAPQFANMMLGMLGGMVLMEWSQRNAGATQPATLFLQSSELLAIHPEAIDPSQFEVPAQLTLRTLAN